MRLEMWVEEYLETPPACHFCGRPIDDEVDSYPVRVTGEQTDCAHAGCLRDNLFRSARARREPLEIETPAGPLIVEAAHPYQYRRIPTPSVQSVECAGCGEIHERPNGRGVNVAGWWRVDTPEGRRRLCQECAVPLYFLPAIP